MRTMSPFQESLGLPNIKSGQCSSWHLFELQQIRLPLNKWGRTDLECQLNNCSGNSTLVLPRSHKLRNGAVDRSHRAQSESQWLDYLLPTLPVIRGCSSRSVKPCSTHLPKTTWVSHGEHHQSATNHLWAPQQPLATIGINKHPLLGGLCRVF